MRIIFRWQKISETLSFISYYIPTTIFIFWFFQLFIAKEFPFINNVNLQRRNNIDGCCQHCIIYIGIVIGKIIYHACSVFMISWFLSSFQWYVLIEIYSLKFSPWKWKLISSFLFYQKKNHFSKFLDNIFFLYQEIK